MQQTGQQLLLLGILFQGKMHGYRLNEHVQHALGRYTDVKKSTVYYALDKLEKECSITQETAREGKRPERRVYKITEEGRTRFLELLRTHLANYERTYYTDDVGVIFMAQLPVAEARQLLTEKQAKIQASLDELLHHPEPDEHASNLRHLLQHSRVHMEADLLWLNGILRELDGTQGERRP